MSSISGARCLLGARRPLPLGRGGSEGVFSFLCLASLWLLKKHPPRKGTTRPSRGQCDAGPFSSRCVLVSSISFVTSHSVDGELGPVPPPLCGHGCHSGVGEPRSRKRVLNVPRAPFSSPLTPSALGPLTPALPMVSPPLAPWSCSCARAPSPTPPRGREAYLCVHPFCLSCHHCLTLRQTPSLASL